MSYIKIDKNVLKSICIQRLEAVEEIRKKALDKATEQAKKVWWRNLLGLPLLSTQEANDRLLKIYHEEMFGGPLGSIQQHYHWGREAPLRLIAASDIATGQDVLLDTHEAEVVKGWSTA